MFTRQKILEEIPKPMKTVFDISIDFAKSHGSYLFDRKSNEYFLDMFSFFSSLPLGYNHPIFGDEFDQTIKPIAHLRMSNNLFASDELEAFVKKLDGISYHKNYHFCATGALAVESALKCGFEYQKNPNAIVLGVQNGFHGINSWGFVTDPNMSSIKERMVNYPRNNWRNSTLDELIKCLTANKEEIASVIIEPIQCTAGDIYLDVDKLKEIQRLCKNNNICFILDEVQTGFGVTGQYWYSEKIGLEPDIIVFGKKSQVCGIMANDKYSEAIHSKYRKLEVTFDGDLIDAIRAHYVINAIEECSLLENVKKHEDTFKSELSGLFKNFRIAGHLIAFDFDTQEERDKFVSSAYTNKLLLNPTGEKTIRLRPNLAFTDDEMSKFFSIIQRVTET